MRIQRNMAHRPAGRLLTLLCATVLAATGCRQIGNVETIRFGREYTQDGERLRVASLQPRCGCVSLANISPQPIWLESWFYSLPRGGEVLRPGERRRILFDWAGPEPSDFYELVAFKVANVNGVDARDDSATGGLRLQDVAAEYNSVVLVGCNDTTCNFGPLAMNRVWGETAVQGQAAGTTPAPGVNFSSVIEVATPVENQCGCMLMENSDADHAVTVRATLHGAETGQLTLEPRQTTRVAFDWAGDLDSDVYVIDAVAVEARTNRLGSRTSGVILPPQGPAQQPGAPPTAAPSASARTAAMTIRLRDYITIQGHMLEMSCTPEYVEFPARPSGAPAPPAPPPGSPPPVSNTEVIRCPWSPNGRPGLGMYSAYDPTRTVVSAATARAAAAAEPAPPAAVVPAP